ncbi:SIR2 family NAD-dependent protein deacylase [Beggiatoa leptomitoformis]|uniref:NAD-dependent protein deacylase n=1 Tax=Beggiatoa leptomitoformis TaxID=288004 RepID=A0A2N9YJ98_9GAMM|nr:NAD-dependent deacylase [Beggiatoa leptomitoformis]ALG67369.1 NAD-dependent protein deacylase [Beggiatoa leptomitoformis]AUI70425.1 NAD-dependent protein deacylase [Beggiatoa leptomitoformis]
MIIPAELTQCLKHSKRLAILTGAGISAESGVPTFRDAQTGLWAQYNPTELATPEAFQQNPKLVWEWYAWRQQLVAKAEPNAGHLALVELEHHQPSLTIVTQNIDGLHQRAGSNRVIELHGNINRFKCATENRILEQWEKQTAIPPHCPYCNGLIRPDVVWFGESLPVFALEQALQAIERSDVLLTIGTSALVQPAATLPLKALQQGATVIEINPETTPLTPCVHFSLRGKSGDILPKLLKSVWGDTQT